MMKKETNFKKNTLSGKKPREKNLNKLRIGAVAMGVVVVVYLVIIRVAMNKFTEHEIPGWIVLGINAMSIAGYGFGLIEDNKEMDTKNDFKNTNIMVFSIFRGARYAFWVAFAAYAFVFQYFDFSRLSQIK